MRTSTAYFAGAGTVVVALAAGLGGGLLMGNIVSPQSAPQEVTKLEQRMASQRSQAAPPAEPVQPAPSAGPIVAVNPPSPSPTPPQPNAQAALPPKSEPANVPAPQPKIEPANAPAAQTAAVTTASPAPVATEPTQPEARKPTRAEESMARARDADLRRIERRRERSERWAERRRQRQDRDLSEVEQAVRDDTERPRRFADGPARDGMPVIRLFGVD